METTKKIKGWFGRLFCKHDYAYLSNIYGDMIRYADWKRSIWKCKKCGKIKYKDNLYYELDYDSFRILD